MKDTTNKVLCILAFASMFYAGFTAGEVRIKNKVIKGCGDTEFIEIYDKGINCSIRKIIK